MSIVGFNWKWEEVGEDIDNIFHRWKQEDIKIFSHWKEDNINSEFDLFIKHFRDY